MSQHNGIDHAPCPPLHTPTQVIEAITDRMSAILENGAVKKLYTLSGDEVSRINDLRVSGWQRPSLFTRTNSSWLTKHHHLHAR